MTRKLDRQAPATTDVAPDDFFLTLNGFDEIAIKRSFRADIGSMREDHFTFLRALVFIDRRRHDQNDIDAHNQALSLTIQELLDYFGDPPEEVELDPDHPETEAGKEGSPSD